MGCIRPATPGFVVTLIATGLLAVVSFCVPYFKSVYFLKASIEVGNTTAGSITFGTLGYCLDLPGNSTCSKPSIGYELDINALVGNSLPIEIPQVAVKWITYALFLHVIALALAAGSAVFGLLAHVREMSMTCCSTCISGFAAAVAMLAFIFDLVLFFVARARINAVGSATIGNAIWLTLAAWILLFFSGCFYTLGRCCVSRRPRGDSGWNKNKDRNHGDHESGGGNSRYDPPPKNDYAERMRLDAVKAEADRKARVAKQKEVGLPAFAENETQPLTARIEGDHVYLDDTASSSAGGSISTAGRKPSTNTLHHQKSTASYAPGGYVQGAPGSRAVDEYYNPTPQGPNTYPPQPQAGAGYGAPQRQGSGYQPGGYGGGYASTSPPPSQMLNVPGGVYNDPYAAQGQAYGHTHGGSSYHTATGGHSQHPSAVGPLPPSTSGFSQYDPYPPTSSSPPHPQPQQAQNYYSPQPNAQYTQREHPAFLAPGLTSSPPPINTTSYAAGGNAMAPTAMDTGYSPAVSQSPTHAGYYDANAGSSNPYLGANDQRQQQGYGANERQYTLSGDGYGASSVPALRDDGGYDPYMHTTYAASPPVPPTQQGNTAYGGYGTVEVGAVSSPVRGPREMPPSSYGGMNRDEEAPPPGYEVGDSGVQGRWGKQ